MTEKKHPTHTLYSITEAPDENGELKATFTPIGSAWTNRDGSLNLVFDKGKTIDPAGRFQIRARKAKAAGGAA